MLNWIKKLTTRNIEDPSYPLATAIDLLGGPPSVSGVRVNHRTALGNPAVWRGVNFVSNKVASVDLHVWKRGANDSRERDRRHVVDRLLRQPSELYPPLIWKQTMMQHTLLHGNGYSAIFRNSEGVPEELRILDPESTYPVREGNRVFYVTEIGGEHVKLNFADVLHFKGLCAENGLVGWSILDVMKDALGLGLSLQQYGATYFRSNGKPSVVITLPPSMRDDTKIERFRSMWGNMHQGLENAHRPALMPHGSDIKPLTGSNEEGQFLQSRELDIILVADILGVPPHKLGASISTSHNSLEEQNLAFLTDTLEGWYVMIEQECEVKLLSEAEKLADSHYIEFNRKQLLKIDAKTEISLIESQLRNRLISEETARRKLNLLAYTPEETWHSESNIMIDGANAPEPPPAPQPVPAPQPSPDASEGDQVAEEPSDGDRAAQGQLEALTRLTVDRLLTRVRKATAAGSFNVEAHRGVWLDSLSPFPSAEAVTDRVMSELEAVLPEQRQAVLDTITTDQLMEALWK